MLVQLIMGGIINNNAGNEESSLSILRSHELIFNNDPGPVRRMMPVPLVLLRILLLGVMLGILPLKQLIDIMLI